MRIKYQDIKLRPDTLATISKANEIIAEYQGKGFDLTIRQLYYQFVSRALIPNTERSYKKLIDVMTSGRMAGLIDWEAIVDRTRHVRQLAHWKDPQSIVAACAAQFRLDKWSNQPYYCEVWIEKDALIGVIEGVCEELDVSYLACRGYTSISEIWRGGHDRFREQYFVNNKECKVFYLGDHDPSGLDMTRDVQDRLNTFVRDDSAVEVIRLALNDDQVEQYDPPPNPTKLTDSRATKYIDQYGETCWELDALEPDVIADLIRNAILGIRDDILWDAAVEEEEEAKSNLTQVSQHWDVVIDALPEP